MGRTVKQTKERRFQSRLISLNSKDPGFKPFFGLNRAKKGIFLKLLAGRLVFSIILSLAIFPSLSANASIFSLVSGIMPGSQAKAEKDVKNNSQNMHLLQATFSPDPNFARGGGDITVIDESALFPDTGPVGTQVDIADEPVSNGEISIYVVRPGDSLSQIARMYGVSVNTIIWANDVKSGVITPGQKLVILPISGVQHAVKTGDTVKSIAKKYKTDVGEILAFNGLSGDADLKVGDIIIIPEGEGAPVQINTGARGTRYSGPEYAGYYIRPVSYADGHKTQGIHGWNGIDIGAKTGTPVVASAAGEVIVARQTGWNGGYGRYLVIRHGNGTQTLYGHLVSIAVPEGTHVSQGQVIGFVGNTGRSTGPHLHFEIRGAKNPF